MNCLLKVPKAVEEFALEITEYAASQRPKARLANI
jgi:hypothetical protein